MRLKEIKPGMVIHCKTKEEMKQAIEYLKIDGDADFIWNYESSFEDDYERRDCLTFDYGGFGSRKYFEGEGREIIEFSDLILPELTAEEAFQWISEHYRDEEWLKCFGKDYCMDDLIRHYGAENVVSMIANWQADHEKKEPVIETVDICRIIEIRPDGRKQCVYEEDIKPDPELPFGGELISVEEILKRYCMEHDGKFIAVHEVVSRVKAVK